VASAPQYCHGIVDPIEKIGEIAIEFSLPLHVDACFGGFMLPWYKHWCTGEDLNTKNSCLG
jgi:sphinganine-1-phosphate aldolase